METSPPPVVRARPKAWQVALVVVAAGFVVAASSVVWGYYDTYAGGGWLRGITPGLLTCVLAAALCSPALLSADTPPWLRRSAVAVVVLALVGPVVGGLLAPTHF